jgi:hypothetical protein
MNDAWRSTPLEPAELRYVGALEPIEVLYEFEGPSIFTVVLPGEGPALVYLCEQRDDERLLRFIVAATTAADVAALKAGTLPVAEALGRGATWVVDTDQSYTPVHAYRTHVRELPPDALPQPGVTLFAVSPPRSASA